MRGGPPLLVREATAADAGAIGDVHAESWRVAHRDLFDRGWLNSLAEARRTGWAARLADRAHARNTLLVAERGDRVAAFVYFGPRGGGVREGEVFECYALPAVWGSGVAWTLMDAAWEMMRDAGFRRVRLWTMAGANRARHFYASFGFTETGRTREYDYGDGRPVLEVEYWRSTR